MKEKDPNEKEEISLEKELYPYVEKFFRKELGLGTVYYDTNNTLSVKLFGSKIRPDVYGINEDEDNMCVVMAEGKWSFDGRNFDICKGQGVSLRRFADKVFLFVRKESWDSLKKKDRRQIKEELRIWGLGLLTIDTSNKECGQILKPSEKNDLLEKEKKEEVFYGLYTKFPKFDDEEFNKRCAASAAKNCEESLWAMINLKDQLSFFNGCSIKPDRDDVINFYIEKSLSNKEFSQKRTYLWVSIYPFGDDISEDLHQQPTLVASVLNDDVTTYLKDKKFREKFRNLVSHIPSVLVSWTKENEELERLEIKKWNNSKSGQLEAFLNNPKLIAMQAYFYVKPLLGQDIDDIIKSTDTILKEIIETYRLNIESLKK